MDQQGIYAAPGHSREWGPLGHCAEGGRGYPSARWQRPAAPIIHSRCVDAPLLHSARNGGKEGRKKKWHRKEVELWAV